MKIKIIKVLTQNSRPNEPASDSIGQKTPNAASHGLLVTGSSLSDVMTVKAKTTANDTEISGSASIPT